MHVFELAKYNGSRDYARLADLAKQKSLICVVDYEMSLRDVAHTIYSNLDGDEVWQLSARGVTYVYATNKEDFARRCLAKNVEFIEPVA